jgi:surface carbohydrate biosynthesis protein (TIGR04326 family)
MKNLLIWDDMNSDSSEGNIVLWNSFNIEKKSNIISIPHLVSLHKYSLRKKYLNWIHNLGKKSIRNINFIDQLELRSGFSYWWMSSLAQKFPSSISSKIPEAIKLLAFEEYVLTKDINYIALRSNSRELSYVIKAMCNSYRIEFYWDQTKSKKNYKINKKNIDKILPETFKAFIYFFWYLYRSLPFLLKTHLPLSTISNDIFFIDILTHFNINEAKNKNFISNYWTKLILKLKELGYKSTWFHNYFYQNSIRSMNDAHILVKGLNCDTEQHFLAESFLDIKIFLKVIKDYLSLRTKIKNIKNIECYFDVENSKLNLWYLFKDEFFSSIKGAEAKKNCIRLSLYENFFTNLPPQKLGIYLQENQPWEISLLYAWKNGNHGPIIGVSHTVIRFWDLRYFYDHRSYNDNISNRLPLPNFTAINNNLAKKFLLDSGYPRKRIIELEALRFLHLPRLSSSSFMKNQLNRNRLKIGILGDFNSNDNNQLLSWISDFSEFLPKKTIYLFKPHPSYPIKLSKYLKMGVQIIEEPLNKFLSNCDLVLVSNSTTAVFDVLYNKIPFIQIHNGEKLNMSPFLDFKKNNFIKSSKELFLAINTFTLDKSEDSDPFFIIDKNLPKWEKALSSLLKAESKL